MGDRSGSQLAMLEVDFIGAPHIQAAIEDMRGYAEEQVTGASYDERVEAILRPVVLSDDPEMAVEDFRNLHRHLREEWGLRGNDLVRAIYRCAQNIRKSEGISRIFD